MLYFHEVLRRELRGESAVMSHEAAEGSRGKRDGARIPGSGPELLLCLLALRPRNYLSSSSIRAGLSMLTGQLVTQLGVKASREM